ncbi:MAG: YeeE/YedE family protein [Proteobacteria bacterium]|nr:YeeE/YedE family protein [Pseudomonadota bacterium]
MEDFPVGLLVAILGFGLGIVFGAAAQRTNFCTMGAISDIVFLEDWNRFRAWMLAIAVAVLGSQVLNQAGLVDLTKSIYLSPNLGWSGAIIGGLLFGFGMTIAGGCGNKTLVRLGAGNLKSLVVALFLGIFAYMTVRGLTGLARVELENLTMVDLTEMGLKTQGIPDIVAAVTALPVETLRLAVSVLVVGGLLWFCFKSAAFRSSRVNIAGGLIIGALIPAAWYVTGVLGADEFEPTAVASFTFIAPVGDSLQYLMTFTGSTINFGIAAIGGVITGAFLMAKAKGEFHFETFTDSGDMIRHIIGGSIMGMGGVLALGCTIGQGVTGMSTLALGSVIALLSILAGGVFGMKYLEHGSFGGTLSALFARG